MLELIEAWWPIIVGLGSVLAGIASFFRWIIPAIRWARRFHKRVDTLVDLSPQIVDGVALIKEIKTSMQDIKLTVADQEQMFLAYLIENDRAWWKANKKGELTWVNHTLCRILHRTPAELLGDQWITHIHDRDREGVAREWNNAISHGRDFGFVFRMVRPDGTTIRVKMRGWLRRCNDAGIIGTAGTLAQVTHDNRSVPHPGDSLSGLTNLMTDSASVSPA